MPCPGHLPPSLSLTHSLSVGTTISFKLHCRPRSTDHSDEPWSAAEKRPRDTRSFSIKFLGQWQRVQEQEGGAEGEGERQIYPTTNLVALGCWLAGRHLDHGCVSHGVKLCVAGLWLPSSHWRPSLPIDDDHEMPPPPPWLPCWCCTSSGASSELWHTESDSLPPCLMDTVPSQCFAFVCSCFFSCLNYYYFIFIYLLFCLVHMPKLLCSFQMSVQNGMLRKSSNQNE